MWFDSQKHFEVKRLILKLTHALGSRPDCVRVEAVISVPTMQRASVMAAHWCHLYHMGGYKHYICDWETATSGFNTTINRRLCSKTVSTARAAPASEALADAAGRRDLRPPRLSDSQRGDGMEAEHCQHRRWDTALPLSSPWAGPVMLCPHRDTGKVNVDAEPLLPANAEPQFSG